MKLFGGLKRKMNAEKLADTKNRIFINKFKKYAFVGTKCIDERQYEAVITRWQHTIEKGLAFTNYRPGFGQTNLDCLLTSMENYVKDGYSTEKFFFRTALSTLNHYVEKNESCGIRNDDVVKRIQALGGTPNDCGGILLFSADSEMEVKTQNYKEFIENRHSMRHFSDGTVDMKLVENAIRLAQHTPSACNRQSWRTIVISDKTILKKALVNVKGCRGFENEFDKLLLIVSDIRCFNLDREIYQAYIDGGMYAQSVLNALHYEHIASVPLSAAMHIENEESIRKILKLHDAEMPIMFIGIGNYPEKCQTARSERKPAIIEIL